MKVAQSKNASLPRQNAPLKFFKLFGLIIPLVFLSCAAAQAAPAKLAGKAQVQRVSTPVHYMRPDEYVQDEILLMPRQGLEQEDLDQSLEAAHGQIKETISNGTLTTYVVHVDRKEFSTAFYKLRQDKNFAVVQCNLLAKQQIFPQTPPNDPNYPQQYHLPLLQIPAAWKLSGSGGGATVGIIDSGVDGEETDLLGRVESGYNVITGGPANHDTSSTGHGTAVAGLMAAGTNNGLLGASPAYNIAIIPTDVFNGGLTATDSNIIKAITYLESQGTRLICLPINDALPNSFNNQNAHPALWTYFKNFWNNYGGFIVNSTGNAGQLDTSPRTKYLIVCSAINSESDPASFTNFGPGISFAAPGVNVGTGNTSNRFAVYSGTSFSAPLVTGILGQAIANNPELTNQQIYNALTTSVTQPPVLHEPYPTSYYYGFGIPNAGQLLQTLIP